MTSNMYRVGDYVYFETSSTSPYQIRRIEELNKTPSGNVEAKVMCFYRRRDLPPHLIQLADKHQCALDETNGSPVSDSALAAEQLGPKQRHQMKHRELFLSRQVETLPATHIRGKCSVTLLNETEALSSYLNRDDMFFYCLVYDPTQKTLLADKGEIRVGSRYQCDVQPMLQDVKKDSRRLSETETLLWTPDHELTDLEIDQVLVVSRSVGTFARALDCSSSVKQPSLHMSASAASRDITLFHAMDALHRHNYDLAKAMCSLVPSKGPVLCRDEMEEWSASEANLFEEALDKYGKDFNDIRQDFLPWKTLKNIIEYYYMWKTTDRYVQQKRVKAVEAESKLKQVFIPNYNKPNPAALNNNKGILNGNSNGSADPVVALSGKACESCNGTVSTQWYAWGPSHMQCRLCQQCWSYWKKYGGIKIPTRFGDGTDFESGEFKLKAHMGRHYATAHGLSVRSGSPRPVMKTRTAFYLLTTPLTKLSRRLCRHIMRPRHAARCPSFAINIQAVKQECATQMANKAQHELQALLRYRKRNRGTVPMISQRLGISPAPTPQWLILTDKALLPQPDVVAFPKPPKAPDGSLLYERVPNKPEAEKIPLNNMSPSLKRKAYEEMNGIDSFYSDMDWDDGSSLNAPLAKRMAKDPIAMVPHHPVLRPASVSAAPMPLSLTSSGSAPTAAVTDPSISSTSYQAAMMAAVAAAAIRPSQMPPGLIGSAAVPGGGGGGGIGGPPMPPRHVTQVNGKPKIAQMTRSGSGRKQVISWMDAPDDLYFRATESSKKVRRQISSAELRRAARKPWRSVRRPDEPPHVVVLD